MVTDLYPYFLAQSKAAWQILRAAERVMMRTEIARSGPGNSGKRFELCMRGQRSAHRLGRIGPLDSRVKSFGVLPEDNHVHPRLLESSRRASCE